MGMQGYPGEKGPLGYRGPRGPNGVPGTHGLPGGVGLAGWKVWNIEATVFCLLLYVPVCTVPILQYDKYLP